MLIWNFLFTVQSTVMCLVNTINVRGIIINLWNMNYITYHMYNYIKLITTSYNILPLYDIENSSDAAQLQRFSQRVAPLCHTQHSAYAVWYNVQSCTPIRRVVFSYRFRFLVIISYLFSDLRYCFFYAYCNILLTSSNVNNSF